MHIRGCGAQVTSDCDKRQGARRACWGSGWRGSGLCQLGSRGCRSLEPQQSTAKAHLQPAGRSLVIGRPRCTRPESTVQESACERAAAHETHFLQKTSRSLSSSSIPGPHPNPYLATTMASYLMHQAPKTRGCTRYTRHTDRAAGAPCPTVAEAWLLSSPARLTAEATP